ncbi:MAG TPA: chloride channel protein [Thermoleophilia bacterium]|nr:chloride channel protein [Thermoleophilia bacterium]
MTDAAAPPDPAAVLRQRSYRGLLVLAAITGVVVSLASWGFLELVHALQDWAFKDLPGELGFSGIPTWWPLPLLALAGPVIAFAILRLPGRGGHEPVEGLKSGPPTTPIQLPGVMLAAFATLGLGLVLGPEAPLIALGSGLGILAVKLARRDAPDQALAVMAAAGSFAAISTIFGSPIVGALIIIEAAGLGGPMLPVVLLPGLIAAGIGSLVFIGMGSLTGLSSSAYAIAPLTLASYPRPTLAAFGWTLVIAVAAALVTFATILLGRVTQRLVHRRTYLMVTVAALLIGVCAIAFFEITGEPANLVLFSGQDGMGAVVQQAATLSLGTLALLIVFKSLAWGLSLGAARGGPTFPAIFLGIVGGLLAAHLPGFSETPAIAVLVAAMCVSMLRLPLSSIVIALIVTRAGLGSTPLIIVGTAVAYLVTVGLAARREAAEGAPASAGAGPAATGATPSPS